jgi:hypothetical protein
MNKIYVVTSGEYSDYHIDGIFDNKDKANAFVKKFSSDDYGGKCYVEEYELNPYSEEMQKDYNPYFVRMMKNGDVDEIYINKSSFGFRGDSNKYGFDIGGNLFFHILAKDKEHAIKITNEFRIQLIANNNWKGNANK